MARWDSRLVRVWIWIGRFSVLMTAAAAVAAQRTAVNRELPIVTIPKGGFVE